MEQSNNFNNPGGGKGPKMPRFNMNWLYTIILIALIALFFSGVLSRYISTRNIREMSIK